MSFPDTAVCVSCSKSKLDESAKCWKLYDSVLFEKSWQAAMALGDPYVLSAKHGLLMPSESIEPYDETLVGTSRDVVLGWAADVHRQLPDFYSSVVLLAGRDYVNPLRHHGFDATVYDPYEKTVGNGQQMKLADALVTEGARRKTLDGAIEAAVDVL